LTFFLPIPLLPSDSSPSSHFALSERRTLFPPATTLGVPLRVFSPREDLPCWRHEGLIVLFPRLPFCHPRGTRFLSDPFSALCLFLFPTVSGRHQSLGTFCLFAFSDTGFSRVPASLRYPTVFPAVACAAVRFRLPECLSDFFASFLLFHVMGPHSFLPCREFSLSPRDPLCSLGLHMATSPVKIIVRSFFIDKHFPPPANPTKYELPSASARVP